MQESWVWSLGWEDPWRREWQPTPVFLPGKPFRQRSLAGYTVHGVAKELGTTKQLNSTGTLGEGSCNVTVRKRERRRCSGRYSANAEVNQKRRQWYEIPKIFHLKPCSGGSRSLQQIQTPATDSPCLSNPFNHWLMLLFQHDWRFSHRVNLQTLWYQVFQSLSKGFPGLYWKKFVPNQKELTQVVKDGPYLQTSRSEVKVAQWCPILQPHGLYRYQFSHSGASDSLRPHEPQHARPPCPSQTPGVHPNPCPLSQWCHPAISSSVVPFSSCSQSFPASGSFPMSQLFTSGGQSIGVAASTSVLPMNTQDWSPLRWTGWISFQSKGLSRVFSNTTVQKHQLFGTQLSL